MKGRKDTSPGSCAQEDTWGGTAPPWGFKGPRRSRTSGYTWEQVKEVEPVVFDLWSALFFSHTLSQEGLYLSFSCSGVRLGQFPSFFHL